MEKKARDVSAGFASGIHLIQLIFWSLSLDDFGKHYNIKRKKPPNIEAWRRGLVLNT